LLVVLFAALVLRAASSVSPLLRRVPECFPVLPLLLAQAVSSLLEGFVGAILNFLAPLFCQVLLSADDSFAIKLPFLLELFFLFFPSSILSLGLSLVLLQIFS
jgi:hypothetical protein